MRASLQAGLLSLFSIINKGTSKIRKMKGENNGEFVEELFHEMVSRVILSHAVNHVYPVTL